MTTKEKIKEYVDDHFNCFGFFPCDVEVDGCLLYTSPSPRDLYQSRMPSSA